MNESENTKRVMGKPEFQPRDIGNKDAQAKQKPRKDAQNKKVQLWQRWRNPKADLFDKSRENINCGLLHRYCRYLEIPILQV